MQAGSSIASMHDRASAGAVGPESGSICTIVQSLSSAELLPERIRHRFSLLGQATLRYKPMPERARYPPVWLRGCAIGHAGMGDNACYVAILRGYWCWCSVPSSRTRR